MVSGFEPDQTASNLKDRHTKFALKQVEIDPVRRHHRGAMTAGGERNENVVLERVPFQPVPLLSVPKLSDQASGLPPIGFGRRPLLA